MDSLVSEIQQLRSAIGAVQLDADSAGLASSTPRVSVIIVIKYRNKSNLSY